MKEVKLKEAAEELACGKVGIVPTDTLYGILGVAQRKDVVERIYKIKKRDPSKPFIVLIDKVGELSIFGVDIEREGVDPWKYWPGKVSIILPCKEQKFDYLHRGKRSLAFRCPKDKNLRELISQTGPVVAPSANYEGDPPLKSMRGVKEYFEGEVDFYVDGGGVNSSPSTLISVKNGKVSVKREGEGLTRL